MRAIHSVISVLTQTLLRENLTSDELSAMDFWVEEFGRKPRKKRAIGFLAKRIIDELPDEPADNERWELTVEEVVKKFQASRGSVYEIFHVFEALLLVTKTGKNSFRWLGFKNLTQTLAFLRIIGIVLDMPSDITQTKQKEVTKMIAAHRLRVMSSQESTCRGCIGTYGICTCPPLVENVFQNSDVDTVAHEVVVHSFDKPHILTLCQKFIMVFLVADTPKTMSLEFVSKVIHGTDLPDGIQKSRARRLYDVSNVMLAISTKFPLLEKVCTTRLNSTRRTAFQYNGPNIEETPLDLEVVMSFPDYRRKHLLFDYGKALFGLPILPETIPGLSMIRRIKPEQDIDGEWPIDTKNDHNMRKMTISELRTCPLSIDEMIRIEAAQMGLTYTVIEVEIPPSENEQIVDEDIDEEEKEKPNEVEEELLRLATIDEVNETGQDQLNQILGNLAYSILPSQSSLEEFFQ